MLVLRLIFRYTMLLMFSMGLKLGAQMVAPVAAGVAGQAVPGRFLVVYGGGAIPENAEAAIWRAGGRMIGRHERVGMATVLSGGDSDTAATRRLAAVPGVVGVFQDRVVRGHQMKTRGIPNTTDFAPLQGNGTVSAAAATVADIFYTLDPQDWAVRQVGGFGRGVAGGTAAVGPWDVTMGAGVRIAILDSGVDAAHPDIAPHLGLNLSEVDQVALPSACDDGTPQDQTGHGTFSASLAAAALGPGTGLMVGVAPEATLLNIKVMQRMPSTEASLGTDAAAQCGAGEPGGLLSWVVKGLDDAIANHADVVSMSLGTLVDTYTGDGAGLVAAFDQVTHAAANAGLVLIAAAGNNGMDLSSGRYVELPAQARDVLAIVASTNPACAQDTTTADPCTPGTPTLAYYSNFGAPLDALAAPGGSYPAGDDFGVSGWVRGACSAGRAETASGLPGDGAHSFGCFNLGHAQYVQAIGTSASAPLAAGVAALYRGAHPGWSAAAVVAAMRASAAAVPGMANPAVSAAGLAP